MSKAVVLLSGGLDSTVLTTKIVREHDKVHAVTAWYGQKHSRELESARLVADHFDIEHHQISLPNIFGKAGSTVVEGGPDQPHLTYKEIAEGVGPSPTVVPFRNANMLSIATTMAVSLEAEWVYTAVHAEDARGWAYPDCTPEFTGAMANAIRVGTYDSVRLAVPFQWMMKSDIVKLGARLSAPMGLTLSCYDGKVPACGRCPTCVERLQAFYDVGMADPISYEPGTRPELANAGS
jgi:7-cyano-7-deazaguanine synthase